MLDLRIERSIDVHATAARVWDVFRNLDDWPRWDPGCAWARSLTPEPWLPGGLVEELRLPRLLGARPMLHRARVEHVDPGRHLEWISVLGGVGGRRAVEIRPLPSGWTRVVVVERARGPLVLAIRALGIPREWARQMDDALRGLKAAAEGHPLPIVPGSTARPPGQDTPPAEPGGPLRTPVDPRAT